MKDLRRKLLQSGLLAVTATVLVAGLVAPGALDRWENSTWDWRARMRASRAAKTARPDSAAICLILMDQQSLDWGRKTNSLPWPWPREVYAPLIQFCRRGGARDLAFDVV
ncbi:MAG: adenylate/guanylate cyclase domain-containing protein, partial [Proteobacteria bacterium]